MKTKMMMVLALLVSLNTFAQSRVGGGFNYQSFIDWCNSATDIIVEAHEEAMIQVNFDGDLALAQSTLYAGLVTSLAQTENSPELFFSESSFYKTLVRGIKMFQFIMSGQRGRSVHLNDIRIQLMYYRLVLNIIKEIDHKNFESYLRQSLDFNPKANEAYNIAISKRFLEILVDSELVIKNSSHVMLNMPIPTYLQIVSFFVSEVANSLEHGMFANAYHCQVSALRRLSLKIQSYLAQRVDSQRDMVIFSQRFSELQRVIKSIDLKECF